MKKLLLFALIFYSLLIVAQTPVKEDSTGNYVSASTKKPPEPATFTGKFYTDSKEERYPVYKTKTGKLFYKKISKKGTLYRVYIKVI